MELTSEVPPFDETTTNIVMNEDYDDGYDDNYGYYDYEIDNPAVLMLGIVGYYLNYVFLILGTVGNFLSICVLVMSFRKKGSSVYLYLAAVAICDTLFICLNSLVNIGSETAKPIPFDWATHCHLFGPGIYIVTELSGLFIMMVTVNRFLAVYAPFKAKEWQTKKITCIIIAILIAIVLAVNWF